MILRPPRSTRTDTLFPYTTLFRYPTPGLSEAGVVELTTGPLGSFVTLTIQRDDDIGPFDVTLELKKWASESFRTEMIDTSAVIALARLDDETLNEVRYQAARVSSHDSGRSPIVLDLRCNIGGLLEPSLATADLFMKHGRIKIGRATGGERGWE